MLCWVLGCRQKARISKIEEELGRLQQEMRQMRLDNQRLKSKVGCVGVCGGCWEAALLADGPGQPPAEEQGGLCGCEWLPVSDVGAVDAVLWVIQAHMPLPQ